MAEPTIWDYEAAISRRARRPSGKGWTRIVVCENIPAATAESLIPAEYTEYPGESGPHASVLFHSHLDTEWKATSNGGRFSRAILYYRPRTCEEWLESNPNKAILLGKSAATGHRVKNYEGTVLEGPDPSDTTGRGEKRISSGSNMVYAYRAVYQVYAVIDSRDVYFYPYVCTVGCYNNTILDHLYLAPVPSREAQWLLTEVSCVPRRSATRLFTARYSFMLNNDTELGWAEPCVSQRWRVEARIVPVKDDAGVQIAERHVSRLIPTGDLPTEANLIKPANFSPINAMLENSW